MLKTTIGLKKRLAAELKAKNLALKKLRLKDLLATSLPYSKLCIGTIDDILQAYLDKYLESFEQESVLEEVKKAPKHFREIIGIFRGHKLDVDDEKVKAVMRFSAEIYNNYVSPTGEIDWVKLVEFNSGNYKPQKT